MNIERPANRLLRKIHQVAEAAGLRTIPPRVVFMHIPKCAGSTIISAAKSYLGSEKSGHVVLLDDFMPEQKRREQIARAKDAQFVSGHFGYETLEQVRKDAYVFTILRDPYDRLRSVYGYFTALEKKNPIPHTLRNLSASAFLASSHEAILQLSDNLIARTIAQTCERARVKFASLDATTAVAVNNLSVFDHIGFVDTLDSDLLTVAEATRIPTFVHPARRNETISYLGETPRPDATAPLTDALRRKVGHLVRADLRVYEAALQMCGRGPEITLDAFAAGD